MKKLKLFILVLVVGMFFAAGIGIANAGNVWYFTIINAGDLVEGETFVAEVYFVNADNGDPDVGNDGYHNLNNHSLDLDYNTDLLEYVRVCYVDHYAPDWSYMLYDGGWLPSQPTEDPIGHLHGIMGIEDLDHQREFYPDDGIDPNSFCNPPCTGCSDRPFNHLANVMFTAKVTGHYDDLSMVFTPLELDTGAMVDYVVYNHLVDFSAWTEGGVAKCSWQYPYVLHLGVDEYGVDYFPQELAGSAWYTGPAAAGQTLRWIYGEPYNNYTVDQAALYTAYHTGDPDQDMSTADVRTLIQTEKPVTSPSYAYNFVAEADDDEDMAIKRFIHWCDFNVQEYYPSATGIHEPQVPSLIVTGDTTYGYQWKTLRGFATSVDPCDESSVFTIPDMEVHGLWLNDPAIGGLGYNVYLTGDEFKATYEQVDGKYRSVCEPPEGIDVELLNRNLVASKIEYARGKPNIKLSGAIMNTAMLVKGDAEKMADDFEEVKWEDVIPGYLMTSPDFNKVYSNCKFNGTLEVADLISSDTYQLVTFSQGREFKPLVKKTCGLIRERLDISYPTASIVLLVDEETGEFRQATYAVEDEKYLPISEGRAIEIAREAVSKETVSKEINRMMDKRSIDKIDTRHRIMPICAEVRLVFDQECSSRFLPMYEVTMLDDTIVHVLQDGTYIIK